jgi:glutamate transport system permease protein
MNVSDLDQLAHGLVATVELTVLAAVGALVLGVVLAICRVSPVPPLRALGTAYVTVLRNIPLLVLLVLFVFGLPEVGLVSGLFNTVVVGMVLYWATFVCEVIRSGVLTVPIGQVEAARALGLTFLQCLRHVILPQALRRMVRPLGNVLIGLTLGTSLAAAVGVPELTGQAEFLTIRYDQPLASFALTTIAYVLISSCSAFIVRTIERKTAISR